MTIAVAEGPAVSARDIVKRYGGVTALNGVSLDVQEGEIFGIIGPNGAGKSTLFDILCGITVPTSGSIRIMGSEIAGMPPHHIARSGVARTFQRTAVFAESTVLENLLLGAMQAFTTASWAESSAARPLLGISRPSRLASRRCSRLSALTKSGIERRACWPMACSAGSLSASR